jgi:hypothetical protein
LGSGANSNHYWAGDHNEEPVGEQSFEPANTGEDSWAYLAGDGASDTDSATSSDNNSLMNNEDIAGMTAGQVDEYLFGRYQSAKRRWRRFTGKPVRALRRVLRRKGKGKGSTGGLGHSYPNINETLQNAYFKGKGKGGKSSGKGFGRKMNPKGRDGEVLKCSICSSQYHLRARCPQCPGDAQPSTGSANVGQIQGTAPQANRPSMYVHFATFQANANSDPSWSYVATPRDEEQNAQTAGEATPHAVPPAGERTPEVHRMTPDDPLQQNDPWRRWMADQQEPPLLNRTTHDQAVQLYDQVQSKHHTPLT